MKNKPFQKTACPQAFSKNCLPASLFKKGLSENDELTFGFENLIPKSYRRDKPAQRLRVNRCNNCSNTLFQKSFTKSGSSFKFDNLIP